MENGWYWVRWGMESGGELEVLYLAPGAGWFSYGSAMTHDSRGFAVVCRVEPPKEDSREPLERLLHREK